MCRFVASTPETLYIELAHGGHLGFYEGGLIYPNPITWMDRAVVAIIGGIVLANHDATRKRNNNTIEGGVGGGAGSAGTSSTTSGTQTSSNAAVVF